MHVDPELLLAVVSDALVLLVETVESSTDDVVLSLDWGAIEFNPLALLDELEDIGSSADAIGESRCCISC